MTKFVCWAFCVSALSVACGGGRATPRTTPAATAPAAGGSVEDLFEAGRYEDAAEATTPSDGPELLLAARLVRAGRTRDTAEIASARTAADAYPTHAIVQFAVGLALMAGGDAAEAARAFDRASAADPNFAYAYYHAGLAYQRLGRTDLVANRFEAFVRLAPQAPERPAVESILKTVRGG